MRTVLLILLGFCFFGLQAQYRISGKVTSSMNGERLPYVNVFIQGSTIGTTTDENGNYELWHKAGKFRLVASMVGYEPLTKVILVNKDIKGTDFLLKLSVKQFDEVEVFGRRDKAWERDIKVFSKEFLGSRYKRQNIVLTNREVINFKKVGGTLMASAKEPLLIENYYLGYRLYFILQNFSVSEKGIRMLGIPRFEEMATTGKGDSLKWEKNRRKTYEGPQKHFFRSFLHCHLTEQSFEVEYYKDMVSKPSFKDLRIITKRVQPNPNVFVLDFPDWVSIMYWPDQSLGQKSTIKKISSIEVDEMGNIFNPFSVVIGGDMGKLRMGQLLPSDYGLAY